MEIDQILESLGKVPASTSYQAYFFVAGNSPQVVYQLASRLAKVYAPLPTKFSLNFVSGAASVLIFGLSESFAENCLEMIAENASGVLALDVTQSNTVSFAKLWVKNLSAKRVQFDILAFNATADQTLTKATECLLRALALTQKAGFARAYQLGDAADVAQAIASRAPLSDFRKVPYYLPPGTDTSSQILQNARSADEIIDRMTERLGAGKPSEEKIFANVEDYIRWVDYMGKCGEDVAEMIGK